MKERGLIGMLAVSKAGHDKDKVYVIVREEGEYLWLSDGKYRKVENPKKKKKKHLGLLKSFSERMGAESFLKDTVLDADIRRILKAYDVHRQNKEN